MKGILKENRKYLMSLFIMIFLTFLLGCGGIIPSDYTITSTAGTGGSINPEGVVNVSEGGDQTFTITPLECYQIADVLVDGVSVGAVSTYLFGDIQLNHTIQASFVVPGPKVHNNISGVNYTTIQSAIDAALSGDTIIVCPGTYAENIEFDGKDITVRSVDSSDPAIVAATIIDGGGSGPVVRFLGSDTSTLEGFTIRNGNAISGGGIDVNHSSPTITGNVITGNTAGGGGGISVHYYSDPTITVNIIKANQADYGGGIYADYHSSPTLRGNTIENNDGVYYGGGIHIYYYSDPTITGNIITGNTAGGGGGISITDNSFPIISDNTINENSSSHTGGGIIVAYSFPIISGNSINENDALSGGGIYLNESDSTIEDNTINENTAVIQGGGICVYGYSDPLIEDNTINENTAVIQGGGICVSYNSNPTIKDNIINNNTASSNGGGIYVYSDSDLFPATARPTGWGSGREDIPTGVPLNPAEGEVCIIAGNQFLGNLHGSTPAFTEGAHVYFY